MPNASAENGQEASCLQRVAAKRWARGVSRQTSSPPAAAERGLHACMRIGVQWQCVRVPGRLAKQLGSHQQTRHGTHSSRVQAADDR